MPGPPLLRDREGCQAWTAALDAAVAAAGVADAEAERIDAVPGLRVDRIGQALRAQAAVNDAAWVAWLARAARLDQRARRAEIDNLPAGTFPLVFSPGEGRAAVPDRAAAQARSDRCRELAVQQLQGGDEAASTPTAPMPTTVPGGDPRAVRAALLERGLVPDRYSTARRALGLYPLVRWPFFAGVQAWQDEHAAVMQRWSEAPPALQRHVPVGALALEAAGSGVTDPTLALARDALGLPQLTAPDEERLLAWHAPVFDIEGRASFDRFGAPGWPTSGSGQAPQVDTTLPVVYTRLAHTRFEGRWLLQLVYTLWFPERPASSSLDLLSGALDGVIVRLTLDEDGQPMLMDTIHACGCYHLFFPSRALQARSEGPKHEEWLFAPAALPALGREARLVVRLSSGSHYVSGLSAAPRRLTDPSDAATVGLARRYALRDENELRSLQASPGSPAGSARRSLYGPDGLVAGSERGERFLFWPMGIASAGATRQWGHHATAFVGRRHFDDVDLIEQRFVRARR